MNRHGGRCCCADPEAPTDSRMPALSREKDQGRSWQSHYSSFHTTVRVVHSQSTPVRQQAAAMRIVYYKRRRLCDWVPRWVEGSIEKVRTLNPSLALPYTDPYLLTGMFMSWNRKYATLYRHPILVISLRWTIQVRPRRLFLRTALIEVPIRLRQIWKAVG